MQSIQHNEIGEIQFVAYWSDGNSQIALVTSRSMAHKHYLQQQLENYRSNRKLPTYYYCLWGSVLNEMGQLAAVPCITNSGRLQGPGPSTRLFKQLIAATQQVTLS
jgi:hypothetical protein